MPSFISKNGVWYPANERAVNIDTGEIYEGKDREAVKIIERETGSKEGTLGQSAVEDPENIMRARQLGMKTEEFLKMNVAPTKEQEEFEKTKENIVVTHAAPRRKRGVSGGQGGFGDIPK